MSDDDLTTAWMAGNERGKDAMRRATNFRKVIEFHRAMGLPVGAEPRHIDVDRAMLREKLMDEEFREWQYEANGGDLNALAKELADLLYVVYGTAAEYGIDIDAVFAQVHESNMSKLGDDGKPVRREDGKVLKGPNYKPPVIRLRGIE